MENYVTKSIFLSSLVLLLSCSTESNEVVVPSAIPPLEVPPPAETVAVIPPPACPEGMVLGANGSYCIDKYEWPNQEGAYPDFAMTAYDARNHCASVSKRMCTHNEWLNACMGKDHLAYGYGSKWNPNACNDNDPGPYQAPQWERMEQGPKAWKVWAKTLYKGKPSGSMPLCSVDEGNDKVYDMVGNVREWVRNPNGNGGYAFESSFWYGTMSGPLGCTFEVTVHSPGFASYEVGTRCCKDVQEAK